MLKGVIGQFNKIMVTILFLFCLCSANAEVYKWVDEKEKVVYGDKPPSMDADEINIKKTPALDPAIKERLEKQQKLLDVIQNDREEKNALKKAEKEKDDEQKKFCKETREKYQKYKDAPFVYEETDDPSNPKIYTDEERKAEELKYKNYIEENC